MSFYSYDEELFFVNGKENFTEQHQAAIIQVLGQNSAVGVVSGYYDEQLPIHFVSKFFLDSMSMSYEQFMEQTKGYFLNLVHEKDRGKFELRTFLGAEGVRRYRLIDGNGNAVWVNEIKVDASDEEGTPIWVLSARVEDQVSGVAALSQMNKQTVWKLNYDEKGHVSGVTYSSVFQELLEEEGVEEFPDAIKTFVHCFPEEDGALLEKALHGASFAGGGDGAQNDFAEAERRYQDFITLLSKNNISEYYIDFEKDTYFAFKRAQYLEAIVPKTGKWSWLRQMYVNQFVDNAYKNEVMAQMENDTLQDHLKADEEVHIKYQVTRVGQARWMRFTFLLAGCDEDGMPQRAIFLCRDITDMVSAEEEEKERLIRTNEELRLAYENAEQANHAKTDFLSQMSHDIRTPMNAILGMAAIAQMHLDSPDKVKDCLEQIKENSQDLLKIMNNILDMSKIETGAMKLSEEDLDLHEFLDDMLEEAMPEVKRHGHLIKVVDLSLIHTKVVCDPYRMKQGFMNLLSNAVRYTKDGGIIKLSAIEEPSDNSKIGNYTFIIEDNGIGMTEEQIAHVYDAYARVEDERISKLSGAGLGIPILKSLVQMMGGTIEVESKVDQGTKFTIHIPMKFQDVQEDVTTCPVGIHMATESDEDKIDVYKTTDFSGKRILLVEDNEINREIAVEILEVTGLAIEAADDGDTAVEMVLSADKGYYDLVLMDIQMPRMNGYEATENIRSIESNPEDHLPIVAMTANANAEDIAAAKKAGMDGHLAKPLDFGKLLGVLNKFLGA